MTKDFERPCIYVVMSFALNERNEMEKGKRYWFSTLERALEYVDLAGKPTPDGRGYYDEPCEYRWYYLVVERCFEGSCSVNEVVGWWEAELGGPGPFLGYPQFLGYKKVENPPMDTSYQCNFTD